MRMSKNRWSLLTVVILSFVLTWAGNSPAQEKGKGRAERTQKVTLQYRVKLDSLMPSSFLAVKAKDLTGPVKLIWDIPAAEAQKKKQFEALIKRLEEKSINGVEFECQGEWLKPDLNAAPQRFEHPLRVTSVPQPTEVAKKRINETRK